MDLDWTGLQNHRFDGFWTGLDWKSTIPLFHNGRQIVIVIEHITFWRISGSKVYRNIHEVKKWITNKCMYLYTLHYQQKFAQSVAVLSGLDWTGLASDPLSWTGLDQDHRLTDLDWTGFFQMNPFHTLLISFPYCFQRRWSLAMETAGAGGRAGRSSGGGVKG